MCCAERGRERATLHRPGWRVETSLSLRSIEFDCDWKGGGGEDAAEDDERDNVRYTGLD